MSKKILPYNVLEGAKQRIAYTFDHFEKIYISFSGGKDSTIMLHLVMDEAIKRNRKVAVMLVDLEGQYKLTVEHMERCFELYKDHIDPYWICVPLHLRNAVSVYEPHWVCWDENRKDDWIRTMPKYAKTKFPFYIADMEFEEFVPEFGRWYGEGKPCACFVGIRTDESLNRWRTIASKTKTRYNDQIWTTQVLPDLYNIYPIYDWKVQDIWHWHSTRPDMPHNRLYDYMHKAGLTLSQMRICQPYGDDQRRGLWLFHLIEPQTWAKVVARVNGANSGALYVQETGNINGYNKITKPAHHTWKSYSQLLLASMPDKTKTQFENKISVFYKWWCERGYPEGIPDEADYKMEAERLAPSWRRVCKSLLRNDYWCKGLGFTQHKTEAYAKYLKLMEKRKQLKEYQYE
jgi:predicted phosphoadenosine phosphosulfate sulfurtransferase